MKVCIVQPRWDDAGLGAFYERGFQALGHDVVRLAPFHGRGTGWWGRAVSRLERRSGTILRQRWQAVTRAIRAARPDLTLIARCEHAPPDLLHDIRNASKGHCWNIYVEHPFIFPVRPALNRRAFYESFSVFFAHSRHIVPLHYQLGARDVRWLPFAYDPRMHRPCPSEQHEGNLAYFGVWGPLVEEWLCEVVGRGLHIYGHHWHRLGHRHPLSACWRRDEGIGSEMAKTIGRHRLIINFSRADRDCTHSMKPFEIAASGGVCIMNRVSDNEIFFRDGSEFCYFDTKDHMLDLIDRLLADERKRETMKANALARVSGHTYESRARTLVRLFDSGHWPADEDWSTPE